MPEKQQKKSTGGKAGSAGGKAGSGGGKAGSGGGGTRAPRGGLAQTVTPDATLAGIIGPGATTRAQVTQKVWEYVRSNQLQDPADKRTIRADARLKAVFGGKDRVTMFEMTRLVNQHLT